MMKHELGRYDAYKDSGIEWLGEVPEHWEIAHLKRFCTKITDGAHTSPDLSSNGYPFLTVVNLNNGILDFKNCLFTSYVDYEKLVRNGCQPKKYDVLYSKDGTISETAVIDEDRSFVVGSSFIIVRPNLKMSNSFFLCYFLTSDIMRYQARIYVKGASLPRISIFNIAKLISIIPPLQEQKAIAVYLGTKTAQIDGKIDLLTQKATQYGKLKQSLINETVTRGLDKTVVMKDSGVEWIGGVPEHWKIRRAKDLFNKKARACFDDDDIVTAFRDGQVTLRLNRRVTGFTNAIKEHGYQRIHAGDLVIHAMDAFAGAIGVSDSTGKSSPVYSAYTAKDKETVYMPYYGKLLRQMALSGFISSLGKGIRERSTEFRHKEFVPLKVVVPALEEQQAIADYLDTKTAHIDRIIETINTQIEKLKELRKTLINDVVTGKIKVSP